MDKEFPVLPRVASTGIDLLDCVLALIGQTNFQSYNEPGSNGISYYITQVDHWQIYAGPSDDASYPYSIELQDHSSLWKSSCVSLLPGIAATCQPARKICLRLFGKHARRESMKRMRYWPRMNSSALIQTKYFFLIQSALALKYPFFGETMLIQSKNQ